jgi:hypothetical protein
VNTLTRLQPAPELKEQSGGFVVLSPRLVVRRLTVVALCFGCFILAGTSLAFSQDVFTYHNDSARTGLNSSETTLTPRNVNSTSFGKLFTLTVDGLVDAQPLYLSSVPISGSGTHNLLIVATENDSVYAFDADAGTPIWHMSALKPGETPSDDRNCNLITPQIGITSTPVISRPKGSNGVIYTVAMSKDSAGNYYQRLHALDATTGKELYGGPVTITAKYPGTGDGSSGGYVIFDPSQYTERSGLLLLSGVVYLTWTSHCDIRPYTGWIMGYNQDTLAQQTVLNVTPNGSQGAIWGAGGGLAADDSGNIFFLDANGIFDTTLNSEGFPSDGNYGNAFIRLTSKGGLAVADYFEMYNGPSESDDDVDLGSGGIILVPDLKDSSGTTWKLAAGAGKDSNLYLVNRDSMGKYNPDSNNIYQELSGALKGGIFSTPAYFDQRLYYGPVGEPIMAFQFKNAMLQSTPVAQTTNSFNYPGATPSISSNGLTNGIVWASSNTNPACLYAYSATNLQQLYNSDQAPDRRDHFGVGNKFIAPLIINGKVYVGTTTGVGVFGLLSK